MKQVRYAVVLNGGVSLAVWMGGVTHELNRIRLSSDALVVAESQAPLSQAWAAILKECDRWAVVDILAGTSAGGLNGTLLATAVGRGGDLPDMRAEWSKVASLDVCKLTRKNPAGADSVLDGKYFEDSITEILEKIKAQNGIEPRECTLLVTATALRSRSTQSILDTGVAVDTADGRRVYKFERTWAPRDATPATDDFRAGGLEATTVAHAARASASFPVAFAPVWETRELVAKRSRPGPEGGSWLVDGGVLDNAPFEPLIDVLRDRATDEPLERVLLYITPGVAAPAGMAQHDEPPPLEIGPALGGVIAAIREPDERLDSDALNKIFTDMSFAKSQASYMIGEYLTAPSTFGVTPFADAAAAVFAKYRTSRAEATQRWLVGRSGRLPVLQPPDPGELTLDPDDVPGMPGRFPDVAGEWHWGLAATDRILRWWGRALTSLPEADDRRSLDTTRESETLEMTMSKVAQSQRDVSACWGVLKAAVSGTRDKPRRLSDQLAAVEAAYAESLDTVLDAAMKRAAKAVADLIPEVDVATLLTVSVAVEVLSGLFSWTGGDYDVPVFRYHRVTPAADRPQGLTATYPVTEEDWVTRKLYGERLGHFGAFVNADGREHDWLWGRLDGASELSKQLLRAANVPKERANELQRNLTAEILAEEGMTQDSVTTNARRVYGVTPQQMLEEMSERDGGEAFAKLDATVWELAKQFKTPGGVVRSVLAPDWRPAEVSRISTLWRTIFRVARPLTWWLRPPLPKLIKRWPFATSDEE